MRGLDWKRRGWAGTSGDSRAESDPSCDFGTDGKQPIDLFFSRDGMLTPNFIARVRPAYLWDDSGILFVYFVALLLFPLHRAL